MDPVNKLLGADGCQIVVGTGTTVVQTGYVAYGCTVRVTGTKITSIIDISSISLIAGEYISFGRERLSSITLNSATDSVTLWLQSTTD